MDQAHLAILNRTLGASVGRPFERVIYRTYEDPGTRAGVAAGLGWLHGEVALAFPGVPLLYLGWGENEGYPDHFSLLAAEESTFKLGTLNDFPAMHAPEWIALRNQPLTAAELRGANKTPHVLLLEFSTGGVAIGDGHGDEFGDGDQILVHPLHDPQISSFQEVFWRTAG